MFKFKGVSSKEMSLIIEEITEVLGKAPQRVILEEIDGYNGAFEDPLGYSRVNRTLSLYLMKKDRLDEVLSWLNGSGEFEYQGRITNISIYDEVTVSRAPNIYKLDVPIIRDPFWELKGNYTEVRNSFTNTGNISIAPIIKLIKNTQSKCELTISGVRFNYDFKTDSFVEIDCKSKTANMNGLRRNRNLSIGFEFPMSNVGNNAIVIHSGDPTIQIKRKDAWL